MTEARQPETPAVDISPAAIDRMTTPGHWDYDEETHRVVVALRAALTRAESDRNQARDDLGQAYQQLDYWWFETWRCPCGARRGGESTHPHVSGCPTAAAITYLARVQPSEGQ